MTEFKDTDNLSFYHKVLLPGLLLTLVGMVGTQAFLLIETAKLSTKIENIEHYAQNRYTSQQAASDWKLQMVIDTQQDLKIDKIEKKIEDLTIRN